MDNFSMNSSPMESHIEGNNSASKETENSDVIIDDDTAYTCRVCSDRATGNHYNVYTCEGCKGFFKRTVQKQLVYHCRGIGAQGMCVVTKASRNNCQFCRFNKCLAVGMLIDAVREDRAPGGKPRQKKPRVSSDGDSMSSTSSSEISKPTTQSSPMQVVKTEVVKDDATEMQAVIQGLLDAKPELRPGPSVNVPGPPLPGDMAAGGGPPFPGCPPPFPGCAPPSESPMPMGAGLPGQPPGGAGVPNPQDITSMEMMKYGYQELRMIIQWAKKVPGFKSINMQDQMALLKACFLDLSVLRVAYRSLDLVGTNKIRYADGLVMSVDEVVTLGWSMDLITCTVEYINQVHSLQLDNVEFAALSALVLTYPDAKGIIDKQNVSDLQSKILECLRYHICTAHPTQTKRYTKILLRLPILREVSAKAKSSFLRMNMDGILQMDQLAGEMLDYDEQR